MTISSRQIEEAFSALMDADWKDDDVEGYRRKLQDAVRMFMEVPELDKLIGFIPELIDPACGMGRQVPSPFDAEQAAFCQLLRDGNRIDAPKAMPNSKVLVDLKFEGRGQNQYILSEADEDMIVAMSNGAAAAYNYESKIVSVPDIIKPESHTVAMIVIPFCMTVQLLLTAHYKDYGADAMRSTLSCIADRLAEALMN